MPGSDPWAPYSPDDKAPWNLRRVVHLHRRAGFAANTRGQRHARRSGAARLHASRFAFVAHPGRGRFRPDEHLFSGCERVHGAGGGHGPSDPGNGL